MSGLLATAELAEELAPAPAAARCWHCGEPAPVDAPQVQFDGVSRTLCCAGCAAAASWIRDAGLADYYQLRALAGPRVEAQPEDYRGWEHPEVLAQHAHQVRGGLEITVLTGQMRCAACAWLIDRALARIDGVFEVSANAVSGRIRLGWDPARVGLPQLLAQLASLGFPPFLAGGTQYEAERRRERRNSLLRLGVAGLGAMQAMMFAEALYLDFAQQMSGLTRDFLRWITLLVATPVVFFAGRPFLDGMRREWRERRMGMDTLIGSSILLAYFASLIETWRGGPHVWFDAAVMFVFLLLLARELEGWARHTANARIDALARARPALARREIGTGAVVQVVPGALQPGDVVHVAAGEVLPADGELLDHQARVDEALLTGEATPVLKLPGQTLLAGSHNHEAALRLRVTRCGQQTRLSQLVRLIERAQAGRPRLARLADAVAAVFVPALFVLAAAVALVWWQLAPHRALEITLAVLVVSCPCALSLAIPTALVAAQSQLARMGVLSLRADALESLSTCDRILLDKTGTLTTGKPELLAVAGSTSVPAAQALRLAAALQQGSGHALARAFAVQDGTLPQVSSVKAHPGLGVSGVFENHELRLGRADFAAAGIDDGAIWLGDGKKALGRFELQDPLRPDAPEAVAQLRALELEPELLSGDGSAAVAALAQSLELHEARARQSPEDKLALLRELQAQGRRVVMVGDGINDGPVLAGADVAFAMAAGSALAHAAADFVVMGESLRRVPQTLALARRTRRIIHQNLSWAVLYNLIALPLAALGWVAPWLAALGMAGSSLLVTLNALRLLRGPA